MAALQVVNQILERNPRIAKTGHPVHYVWIDHDYGFSRHMFTLTFGSSTLKERPGMAKNVALPDDLVTAVEERARAEGKTADELIEEATRRYLARQRLDRFVRRNERQARGLGITEADVPKIVKQFRREHRGR